MSHRAELHNFNELHLYQLIWATPTANIQVSENNRGSSIQTVFPETKGHQACDTGVIIIIYLATKAENTHQSQESGARKSRGGNQHKLDLR